MKVEFQSKHPHNTKWLHVEFDENERDVYNNLRGWLTSVGMFKVDEPRAPKGHPNEATFYADGTGLFGGWTPAEHDLYMDRFKRILAQPDCLNLKKVKYRKLTLHDLL